MSSRPVAFGALQDVDHLRAEPDAGTAELAESVESSDFLRGVLLGFALCTPFWAGVYWVVRSLF